MSKKTICISVPDAVRERMRAYPAFTNWSKVATEAFDQLMSRGQRATISFHQGEWVAKCGDSTVATDKTLVSLYEQLEDLGL